MVSDMSPPLYHNDEKQSAVSEPARASLNIRALQSSPIRSTTRDRYALQPISRVLWYQKIAVAAQEAFLLKGLQRTPFG